MYVSNYASTVHLSTILADLKQDWECRDFGYDPVYGLYEDLTFDANESHGQLSAVQSHALKVVTRVLALRGQLDD